MKKTKILLGAVSVAALAPTLPMALSGCSKTQATYTVTFDSNGGTSVPSQLVLAGNPAANPSVTREGYKFIGWFNGDTQWDFNTVVTENITLTAHWDTKPITLVLYAGDGQFATSDATNILTLTNVAPGTKIKDIAHYVTPTLTAQTFAYWVDVENNKYTEDTEVNENLLLGARYIEAPDESNDYKTCNWSNIIKYTSSAVAFANKFMEGTFESEDEEDAIDFINDQITADAQAEAGTETVFADRTMKLTSLGSSVDAKVRLIGVGFDKNEEESNSKTMFTFEFTQTISKAQYSYHSNNTWCEYDEEGEEINSCYLRDDCNTYVINALPANVVEAIQTVTKHTYKPKTASSEQFTKIDTQEKLFPLSFSEIGVTRGTSVTTYNMPMETKATEAYPYYQFETTVSLDGDKHSSKTYAVDPTSSPTYWMRDPINIFYASGGIERKVYAMNVSKKYTIWDYTNNAFAIAPAFCL